MVVKCKICDFSCNTQLQSHLYHKHGTTPTKYKKLFPGAETLSESFKIEKRRIAKENANTVKALEIKSKNGKSNKGKKRSEEWKKKRSAKYSGEGNPFHGKHHSLETRVKLSCHFRGIEIDKFDKFTKPLTQREVGSGSFKIWRKKVFERDNYTCLFCNKRGGDLEPHHILPRRENKDLIYTVTNGATLCVPCHRTTFKKEHEFIEFLTEKVAGRIAISRS